MKLLADRIGIAVDVEDTSKTESGIIIAAAPAKEKKNTGIVKLLGEGRYLNDGTLIPINLNIGDRVVFTPFSGSEMVIGDEVLLVVREADIIAVL